MNRKELQRIAERVRDYRASQQPDPEFHWYGASIQGTRRGAPPVACLREWRGWPLDIDVPLPPKARP